MKQNLKLFFAFTTLTLCGTFSIQAQDTLDVAWYQNLFRHQKNISIKEILRQADNKRIDANRLNDKTSEVKALIELSVFRLTLVNDYEPSMSLLIRSLAIEDSLNMANEKIFTLLAMARVFEEVGDYYKSLEFLKQAQQLNDQLNKPSTQTLILNETGRVEAAHGLLDEAFESYELALEYARKLGQQGLEGDALFHLAQLRSRKKQYKEALETHKQALAIRRSINDKSNEAQSLNDIGELYILMKNQDRALANHVEALEIRQSLKDKKGLAESFNNVGVLYMEQKNFKRAISNLILALQNAREAQAQDELLTTYDYLSRCYKLAGDFEKALVYKESYQGIYEFIQSKKNDRQLLETQNRYTMNKMESAIHVLESDRLQRERVIDSQKKLRNFLFLVMALTTIIATLVLYLYFVKRRSTQRLKDLNATKDKLFSIIGHDLKGPLNSFTAFSSLLINHADSLTKEEIKTLSIDLDKSLKNLLTLLENLLEWSRSQTGNIDFKREKFSLTSLLKENEELLKGMAQNKSINLINESKSDLEVNAHRHSINTVIRNLLSNAIKFTPQGGTIRLGVAQNNNQLVVSVTDTGVGMSSTVRQKLFMIGAKHSTLGTAKEKGTGLGLILCKDFVEKNGGTIHVESKEGSGSRFYFELPLN